MVQYQPLAYRQAGLILVLAERLIMLLLLVGSL